MSRPRLGLLLQLALLAAVALALWHRLGPELSKVSAADFARWRPAVGPLILATLGLTLMDVAQAFVWRRIVADVGAPLPDARSALRVYFVSALARYIPGSVWQFAGLAVLAPQAGIPALAATAAAVLGNLVMLATGVVFAAFTLPGASGVGELLGLVGGAAVVAAGWFLFAGSRTGARVRAWVARRAPTKVAPVLELAGRIRPGHALAWTLSLLACWFVYAVSFTVFVAAFVPGAWAHLWYLGGVVTASFLAGYIVVVAPSGFGVRELTMAGLLAKVLPLPAAVVIAVAARVWTMVAELLALATFPLMPGRRGGAGASRDDKLTGGM